MQVHPPHSEAVRDPVAADARLPRRVIVLSDLHIGAGGSEPGGDPLECFFYDVELAALLDRLARRWTRRRLRGMLVLNGDVFDFVRVVRLPTDASEVQAWTSLLAVARVVAPPRALAAAAAGRFSGLERRYGPGTSEHESVWKLWVMAQGHARLFDALAAWCQAGHDLVVLRGNHDVEWAWPGVRRAFRALLEHHGSGPLGAGQVRFRMHAFRRRNLHIEHGHQVSWTTAVAGRFTRGRRRALQQPFGSLLNRYLLNPVERRAQRAPAVPSSLHLKRLVEREPGWLWRRLLRNAFRDVPAAGRATWSIWQRRALAWWPALVGDALALGVLALSFLHPKWLRDLSLDSASARTGTALLAFMTPQLGLAVVEILNALHDDAVQRARAHARQLAGHLAAGPPGAERLVVLGHTHMPELQRWTGDGADIVYANPSCWLGEDGHGGGPPHFVWCAWRRGAYGRTRVLELDPVPGRCRTHPSTTPATVS